MKPGGSKRANEAWDRHQAMPVKAWSFDVKDARPSSPPEDWHKVTPDRLKEYRKQLNVSGFAIALQLRNGQVVYVRPKPRFKP